jgi:hypothetical protein
MDHAFMLNRRTAGQEFGWNRRMSKGRVERLQCLCFLTFVSGQRRCAVE